MNPDQKIIKILNGNITPTQKVPFAPQLLIPVIRIAGLTKQKITKRYLMLFWEFLPRRAADGEFIKELILICEHLRTSLGGPRAWNEFERAATLRFLTKINEPELLTHLIDLVLANVENTRPIIRRAAIWAVFSIYRNPAAKDLIPNAPEIISELLKSETDISCQRVAIIMLTQTDTEKALEWLNENMENIAAFDSTILSSIIELIRKVCKESPRQSFKYIRVIYQLLFHEDMALQFSAAETLVMLSTAPPAVSASAKTFVQILKDSEDHNIILMILEKLEHLKKINSSAISDLLMDIFSAMSTSDLDIRRKTLELAISLLNPTNVDDILSIIKSEISKTIKPSTQVWYQRILISALRECIEKYPKHAASIIPSISPIITSVNASQAATDVVEFFRSLAQKNKDLQPTILTFFVDECLPTVSNISLISSILWIIGQYSTTFKEIRSAIAIILKNLQPMPFNPSLEVGVVAGNFHQHVISGNWFFCTILISTLTKLVFRIAEIYAADVPNNEAEAQNHKKTINHLKAKVALIATYMLSYGTTCSPDIKIGPNSFEKISSFISLLNVTDLPSDHPFHAIRKLKMPTQINTIYKWNGSESDGTSIVPPDQVVDFGILQSGALGEKLADQDILNLLRESSIIEDEQVFGDTGEIRHLQLTGYSDPIYCEAILHLNKSDILLDLTLVNQNPTQHLVDVSIEFDTFGDVNLCDRPPTMNLLPGKPVKCSSSFRITSTERSMIFGSIIYDTPKQLPKRAKGLPASATVSQLDSLGTGQIHIISLETIQLDVMDYLEPSSCSEQEFRDLWVIYEWENPISISPKSGSLSSFLDSIIKATKMTCLTPRESLEGECGFLSAKLYSKSIFGEDALANVSLYTTDGLTTGHVRIRSKSQDIALALGRAVQSI